MSFLFRWGQALWAPLILVLVMVSGAPVARAQAVAGPASLTSITLSDGAAGETKVVLGFNQVTPQFSIVSNDVDKPVIGFVNTIRATSARVAEGGHGLIKGVEFNQREAVLTLALVGAGAIHVEPQVKGEALTLTITAARSATRSSEAQPAGPVSVPAHADAAPGEDGFEVVPLKYADVSEVVGLLTTGAPIHPNDTFTPQEPAFGSSGFTNGNQQNTLLNNPVNNPLSQDAASTTYGQTIDEAIGIDRRLNAIILKGSPDRIARLKAKIAQLDVPVRSVVLETVFVELTEQGVRNVGLDFRNPNGQVAVASYGSNGNNLIIDTERNQIRAPAFGTFSLQAAIYAQVQKGQGRILSRPRIAAPSGGSAKIITGDALPILTSIALSGVNAVSQQVQYVNVGVTLQIAPRVADDGFVTSHVFAEVSTVTGFSQGYPTISQREASTSATVKDGDYFVIGGLTQESHLTTKGKIPVLGDIPVAGELFKLHEESRSRTELFIIVTPHVSTDADEPIAKARANR